MNTESEVADVKINRNSVYLLTLIGLKHSHLNLFEFYAVMKLNIVKYDVKTWLVYIDHYWFAKFGYM